MVIKYLTQNLFMKLLASSGLDKIKTHTHYPNNLIENNNGGHSANT
jgi:hypothetical protein